MSISRNQIIKNARKFSKDWKDEVSEKAESQTFWNEFFAVFGISRRQVGIFEAKLTKLNGHRGFIDVFWPGKLVCEQKSRGQDLDKAFHQAIEYLEATAKVDSAQLPRYVIVCDFEFLRLYDLETQEQTQIFVAELADHVHLFGFLHDQITEIKQAEEAANIEAAEKMGKLHDQLKAIGYDGHALEVMLIRLLFCLFAEDTGIFAKYQFTNFIQRKTKADGSDLAPQIAMLFYVLNQPEEQRLKNLDQDLADFAYINGQLFAEPLPPASFDDEMRNLLLEACEMDWSKISPEIFGALFQSVMDAEQRRSLGAHYTSEENILKVISSLFMDDLRAEFEELRRKGRGKSRTAALDTFHEKLASLDFLDPACGCGNFLIVAYRELRLLELDVIEEIYAKGQLLDVSTIVRCNVSQFHGIEIEDFPSQIARVAMWLIDHQINMLVSEHYGTHFARIPLKSVADIQNADALSALWPTVDYIFGNPPFIGKNYQTPEQKQSLAQVASDLPNFASLDFVAGWYVKAAKIMLKSQYVRTAFVSTNSICQGEQALLLWSFILNKGFSIDFAHQTFVWQNAARGKAAVHCIIVGFSINNLNKKYLFEYNNPKETPDKKEVNNINQYLLNAPTNFIVKRPKALPYAPLMTRGSQPTDGGNLLLNLEEKNELEKMNPIAKEFIKPFAMGDEFINNTPRFCLWLVDIAPSQLKQMPLVIQRIEKVKMMRLASTKASTKKWADRAHLFTENRQPTTSYLALPRVSSERRIYVPIGFLGADFIAGDKLQIIPNATLYDFGIMCSIMHNAWLRVVSGRLKSDYQYSASVVYNNFPWPSKLTDTQRKAIEDAAQSVLDARAKYPDNSLADLYDPLLMPSELLKAHQALDKAVDAAYSRKKFNSEAERVAFLFELYEQYVEVEKAEQEKLVKTKKPKAKKRQ
ncbi:class I SAM-dependent DNA methyltransferase [Acinetobacter variabilis]|uniref:class I SAM-dependent DNA methyltransferase n=1 Tax=Acinetobacter variabilis TaxID=70346 RepID=UPI0030FCD707